MLVRVYKAARKPELDKLLQDPADPRIQQANTWKEALQRKAGARNVSGWDRYSMARSITKHGENMQGSGGRTGAICGRSADQELQGIR